MNVAHVGSPRCSTTLQFLPRLRNDVSCNPCKHFNHTSRAARDSMTKNLLASPHNFLGKISTLIKLFLRQRNRSTTKGGPSISPLHLLHPTPSISLARTSTANIYLDSDPPIPQNVSKASNGSRSRRAKPCYSQITRQARIKQVLRRLQAKQASALGIMEHWRLRLHPMFRHPPWHGNTHISGEISGLGFVDGRADAEYATMGQRKSE